MDYTDNAVTASFNKQCIYHWLKTKNQNQTRQVYVEIDKFACTMRGCMKMLKIHSKFVVVGHIVWANLPVSTTSGVAPKK